MLNRDALRWYEKHRRKPSGAGRVIWTTYVALAIAAIVYVNFHAWINGAWNEIPSLVNCAIVGLGLLLATVHAVTALADERTRGSLDILLLTPVPTKHILWAKWRSAFGIVVRLSCLPLGVALIVYWWTEHMTMPGWWGNDRHNQEMLIEILAIPLVVVSSGALLTSVGLLLATWNKNLSRAVGLAITFWLSIVVIWPIFARIVLPSMFGEIAFSLFSPAYAVWYTTNRIEQQFYWYGNNTEWKVVLAFVIGFNIIFAIFTYALTWIIFDRKMGRISRDKPVALKDRSIWMTPVFGRGLRDVVE